MISWRFKLKSGGFSNIRPDFLNTHRPCCCQAHPANHTSQTKCQSLQEEPASPSRSDTRETPDLEKQKFGDTMTVNCLIMNNAQPITRYIVHWRDSGMRKFCTFIKLNL